MLKALFYSMRLIFLNRALLLPLVLFFPSLTLAWNNMCYSPVQIAALMSKPKNKNDAPGLARQIRKVDNNLKTVREGFEDLEDLLADSLDRTKLGGKESKVASQIRSYIESQMDGWDCYSGSFAFFNHWTDLFIPSAFADGNYNSKGTVLRQAEVTRTVRKSTNAQADDVGNKTEAPKTEIEEDEKSEKTKLGTGPQNASENVDFRNLPDVIDRVDSPEQCRAEGRVWNNDQNKCCASGQKLEGFHRARRCVEKITTDTPTQQERLCKSGGGTWKNGNCYCDKGSIWSQGRCRACRADQEVQNNQCVCPAGTQDREGACRKLPDPPKEQTIPVRIEPQKADNPPPRAPRAPSRARSAPPKRPAPKAEPAPPKGSQSPCSPWKRHRAFDKEGRVQLSFCDTYALNKEDCEEALSEMEELVNDINELKELRADLKKKWRKAKMASVKGDREKTEAGGLCIDCLKRVMAGSRPSTGQSIGNVLNIIAGAGIGVAGYNFGRHSQRDVNRLRVQQGYPAQNDYYPLMGASAGFPFVAKGLYGLTRSNTPVGGWACSSTVSPYSSMYNYHYGHGFNMGY